MQISDEGVQQTRRRITISAVFLFAGFAALAVAWGVDTALAADTVGRNVHMRGTDLSGMTSAEVRSVAAELTDQLAADPVTIAVGDAAVQSDLNRLGARVDSDSVVSAAFSARTGGSLITGPFRWLWTFRSPVELNLPYVIDGASIDAAVQNFISPQLNGPSSPSVVLDGERFVTQPGGSGVVVDPAQLAERVTAAIGTEGPYQFTLTPYPQQPDLSLDSVGRVAGELNKATSEPLEVRVLDQTTILESAELRSLIDVENTLEGSFWQVNQERALVLLLDRFDRLGDQDQQARFIVVQDKPEIVAADETVVCCDDKTAALLRAALLTSAGNPDEDVSSEGVAGEGSSPTGEETPAAPGSSEQPQRIVELLPIITDGTKGVAELEALGINELVSTFTTNHPCCASRVTNIQLFADTLRGEIIEPGGTLSLNGVVGERTAEKGYEKAGAISRGELEPQYGGGVSQVATTTFNAAFFAGLDFTEYQAHSIYFSRYPRGREATISYPRPDLKIKNNTAYGVLVWTEHTPTSITVSMYSTKNIAVEDVGTSSRRQGECTRVTTTRERTYTDGTSETDTVFALYRPAEGLDCNGNPSNPESVPAATTPPATAAPTTPAPTTPAPTSAPATTTPVPTTAPTTAALTSPTSAATELETSPPEEPSADLAPASTQTPPASSAAQP